MSSIQHLVAGCCAGGDAPFGQHPHDARRAARYLEAALDANLSWNDAEGDVRAYAAAQGRTDEETQAQVERARKLLKPWLA